MGCWRSGWLVRLKVGLNALTLQATPLTLDSLALITQLTLNFLRMANSRMAHAPSLQAVAFQEATAPTLGSRVDFLARTPHFLLLPTALSLLLGRRTALALDSLARSF